ncbi:MAG: DHH family phosphoesterase, partial [Betaproteobacteria bacterium]
MKISVREVPPRSVWALEQAGVHPLLAQLFAARGIHDASDLDENLQRLIEPTQLLKADEAAHLLADAMQASRRICIVADYDCDGATACAVGIRGLGLLGQVLDYTDLTYLVPDRVVDGYGLTPVIAERVRDRGADVLVTVDNGIASLEGVARARELGLQVLITDHHLPALQGAEIVLPEADVIVNPNQPGCP